MTVTRLGSVAGIESSLGALVFVVTHNIEIIENSVEVGRLNYR